MGIFSWTPTEALQPELSRRTYVTLLGLFSVTGLRTIEACWLENQGVDPTNGTLLVRSSKFGRSRDAPLHETTLTALQDYAQERDRIST